eukprot:Em0071g19a
MTYPKETEKTYPKGTEKTYPKGTERTYPKGTERTYPKRTERTYPKGTERTYPKGTEKSEKRNFRRKTGGLLPVLLAFSLYCWPSPYSVGLVECGYAYILVQAYTSGGCGQSNSSSLKTLQAMSTSQAAPNVTALNAVTALSNPNGLLIHSPLILNTNSSSMSLQWNAPLQPDYVITAYTLHHRVPSLKSQSEMWAPPLTATVQFHTYNPSGILFYQINSVMTDFLGVKPHGGLPWLIFYVGYGPAVVGSNSTRTFNDGQWHTVSFRTHRSC